MRKVTLILTALIVGLAVPAAAKDKCKQAKALGDPDAIAKFCKHDHEMNPGDAQAIKDQQSCYRYCDQEREACDVPGVSDSKKRECSAVRILCQQECDREFR